MLSYATNSFLWVRGVGIVGMSDYCKCTMQKQFLNLFVYMYLPNVLADGDTVRLPLSVEATIHVMKYWSRQRKKDGNRLLSQVYTVMLRNLSCCTNWVFKIKKILMNDILDH